MTRRVLRRPFDAGPAARGYEAKQAKHPNGQSAQPRRAFGQAHNSDGFEGVVPASRPQPFGDGRVHSGAAPPWDDTAPVQRCTWRCGDG